MRRHPHAFELMIGVLIVSAIVVAIALLILSANT